MKKFSLVIALCASAALFVQCKQTPANQFKLVGTTTSTPTEALITYNVDGQDITDTLQIAENAFTFTDTISEPTQAMITVSFAAAEEGARAPKWANRIVLEPGTININIPENMAEATIAGSPTNDEIAAWKTTSDSLRKEIEQLTAEYTAVPDAEKESRLEEFRTKVMAAQEKGKTAAKEYIAANPASWFALMNLYPQIAGSDDIEGTQNLLNTFAEPLKSSKLAAKAQEQIEKWKTVTVGATAPDFTQNDVDGNPVKLSDFRGKWVLVDFWAAWCGPCRGENPNVVATYNQYKDKGFTVLGVSLDNNKDAWVKAIADDKLAWTQVADFKGWQNEAAQLYSVQSIPANWLLNPEGVIVAKNLRGEALGAKLAEVLAQ